MIRGSVCVGPALSPRCIERDDLSVERAEESASATDDGCLIIRVLSAVLETGRNGGRVHRRTIVRALRAGLPRGATDGAGLPPQIDVQAGHEVHAGSHGLTIPARRGLVNA